MDIGVYVFGTFSVYSNPFPSGEHLPTFTVQRAKHCTKAIAAQEAGFVCVGLGRELRLYKREILYKTPPLGSLFAEPVGCQFRIESDRPSDTV